MVSLVTDAKNWPKTMDSLEEYLRGDIGLKGVPLYYVVRSEAAVDSSLGEPDTSFLSAEDEMVARAPIVEGGLRTVTFKTDMMKFWGMISVITRYLDFWTYIKSDQRTRDGSKAYRDLWDHFLVPDNVDNMACEAESLLAITRYYGEHKRLNFERYMKIQKYQHHILEVLKEYGHVGFYPRYQVRHLIEFIKITQFDAVKDQIMETDHLRTDYDGCVSLYKTLIDQSKKVSPPELNILGVESYNHKQGGQKKRKGGSGGDVEDVYYFKEEYKALSSDQRASLYKKRQARVHNPAENKVRSKKGGATDELAKQLSALVAVMKSSPEAPGTDTPTTNSKKPALTRKIILRK